MSRPAGNQLPAAVRAMLSGDHLEDVVGLTAQLITVDGDGWPRVALLTPGEILATGPRRLRLALWPGSTTTANLTRAGRATLAMVHAGAGWYFRCSARRSRDMELAGGRNLAAFALIVDEALEDAVPDADLTTGICFHLAEPQATLEAWRESLSALREG